MNILETDWFLRLVHKSSDSPQGKLIGIFDVLSDWIEAPQIGQQLLATNMPAQPPPCLFYFLVNQAKACGAAMPEALAHQLYFMLMCGIRNYEQQQNSLSIARQTAEALIQAQLQVIAPSNFNHYRSFSKYAIASFATASLLAAMTTGYMFLQPTKQNIIKVAQLSAPVHVSSYQAYNNLPTTILTIISHDASPSQTAEMLAKIEQMRKGTCIYPEVLMLPQKQRDIYLQSVVHGEIPSSIEDQLLMTKLMEKVRCNYSPMLMQNSVG